MKARLLALCCLALLGSAGCRTRPAITLLEHENRDLEDRVYELADLVDQLRCENADLHERLGTEEGGPEPIGLGLPLELTEPSPRPRSTGAEIPDPGGLESLDVEVPPLDTPVEPPPGSDREGGGAPPPAPLPAWPTQRTEAPKWNGASDAAPEPPNPRTAAQQTAQLVAEQPQPAADNTVVAAITLNQRLTRGYNLDGRDGDEGILVEIEPRDAGGQLVAAAAPVAVVVLDPHLAGDAARVARWDFSAEEITRRCRKAPDAEGIRLEMVWPGAPPIHDRLHLFVRYQTDDGRNLEADQTIEIDVPGLEPELAKSAGQSDPVPEASPSASRWQGKPVAVTPLPTTEAARTARLPRRARPAPESPASEATAPKRSVPAWSPDRP
jgi:hypothetical protein